MVDSGFQHKFFFFNSNLDFAFQSELFSFLTLQLNIKILQNRDFPGGPVVKNLPANAWDVDSIPGPGRFHMPLATKPMSHNY